MSVSLRADIGVRRGRFELAARFELPAGAVLAILGPNGSGKSTILDCVAGLVVPDDGRVTLGTRTLTDPANGIRVPPHARGVGLLAQDPLLFPHLSVVDNVAFALTARGMRASSARERALSWLDRVDLADLAARKPAQLSGGQAQRVAVARALAGAPELLLLDEPLAALDVDAAPAVRGLLRSVLRDGQTSLLVTHDPLDALALADQVLVLDDGQVVERGETRAVLAAPRTPFTAQLAGLNLVGGVATAEGLRTTDGAVVHGSVGADVALGEPAVAVFSPGVVAVYPDSANPGGGSPRNTSVALVAAVEPHGSVLRVRAESTAGGAGWVRGIAADLTPAAVAELDLAPGSRIRLAVKATTVAVHPAAESIGLGT